MTVKMDIKTLTKFLAEVFPQVGDQFEILDLRDHHIRVRLRVSEQHLRPGGTISGPAMFALADVSVYLLVMAMIGPEALAVTTNASFDFMRKPAANTDLIAECRLLKLGRVLAVGDVLIHSEGDERPVARSTMTYSIPPKA